MPEPDIIVGRLYLPKPCVDSDFPVIAWFKNLIQPGLLLEVRHKLEAKSWTNHSLTERHWAHFLINEQSFWILKPTLTDPWLYYLNEVK
ncbi:MAG: hypothetical protein WC761_01165 [Candidatus Paceibacterota bacterium]|jgi:hypothetical protein